MYFYVNKIIFIIIFMSFLSAKDIIEVRGKIIKVFNDGTREKFSNQKICIKNERICTNAYSKGNFSFKYINKYLPKGKKVKLEIANKNWFMLSPFKGIYHIPNKSEKIEIIMIPKDSSIYLTLFAKTSNYTIQILHVNNEQRAIDMVNKLRKDCLNKKQTLLPNRLKNPCWRKYRKESNQRKCLERQKQLYCSKDNIYYQSILRNHKPHNGFSYNVFFGKYSKNEYQKAKEDLIFIKRKYNIKKDIWIAWHNKIIEK